MTKENQKPVGEENEVIDSSHELLLFNDDVNTFDFVIETLIDVCQHEQHQAEQCTWIAHYKGKCAVKSGFMSELCNKSFNPALA